MSLNLRPPLRPAHGLFGAAATFRPTGGLPIVTTVLPHRGAAPPAVGALGMSAPSEVDLRTVLSLIRADVPTAPVLGDQIEVDLGDGPRTYQVDRVDAHTPDEWRVVVSGAEVP